MGRLEALVVAALGRSPYDEQLITSQNSQDNTGIVGTGQRYDDRGHPINFETRQRMRDHVRASNEVMHAAGIIEETADVQARDKIFEDAINEETAIGYRRLEIGRVLLVAGVWGVCGLRRRILLYKTYSGGPVNIIRMERSQYSVPHILSAGIPALAVNQCAAWTSLLIRAIISGPYGAPKVPENELKGYTKWILRTILDNGFTYMMLHYQMFAILQQLNLISSDRLFPNLRSIVPFSPSSPLQIPHTPKAFTPMALYSWLTEIVGVIAPFGLILTYAGLNSFISAKVYAPIYRMLPRPMGRKDTLSNEDGEAHFDEQEPNSSDLRPETPHANSTTTANIDTPFSDTSDAHSQHTATLEALEGRQSHRDDSSDEEDHEISQQTLITFDIEATEVSDALMGTWSAELRSANEPPPKENVYHITALTMLPPLLAAEGLSVVLSGIVLLPLEALMVRTLAKSFRKSARMGTGDMFTGFEATGQAIINILAVNAMELAVTGVLWAAYTVGSQVLAGKFVLGRSGDLGSEDN